MKTFPILTAATLTFCAASVLASPPSQGPRSHHGFSPEQRIERMTSQLDLSAEQQDAISAILTDYQAEQAKALTAMQGKIDALLTDEQRQQLASMRQQAQQRLIDRLTNKVDLSDAQQQQMRDLFEKDGASGFITPWNMHAAIQDILTDEQKAQLTKKRRRPGSDRGESTR